MAGVDRHIVEIDDPADVDFVGPGCRRITRDTNVRSDRREPALIERPEHVVEGTVFEHQDDDVFDSGVHRASGSTCRIYALATRSFP
jgi:hypothetical protein